MQIQINLNTMIGLTSITLDTNIHRTWLDLKQLVLQEQNIPIDRQRIIMCGDEMHDHAPIDYHKISLIPCIHLILRHDGLQFTLDTHDLYAVVHNFYEKVEDAELCSLQSVIPLSGHESPEELRELFERMYHVREQLIAKNQLHEPYRARDREHVLPKANPIVAIMGIKKDARLITVENDGDGTHTLLSIEDGYHLEKELFSYMLEDGTAVSSQINDARTRTSREINTISQAFRLFCAEKFAQSPQFQQQCRDVILRNYGEISAYFEYTADFIFEEKTTEQKIEIIRKVRDVCHGIRPQNDDLYYADIMALDLIAMAENFQLVKIKLNGKNRLEKNAILDECKTVIKALLLDKLDVHENQLIQEGRNQQRDFQVNATPAGTANRPFFQENKEEKSDVCLSKNSTPNKGKPKEEGSNERSCCLM